jgi:hypothetical protein
MSARIAFATAVAAATVLAGSGRVSAQPQPPVINRPTFSPYLNLLGGFGSPAINYYGLVRPQMQFMQQQAQIQQQLNMQTQAIQAQNTAIANGLVDPLLPVTGRGATFGYYSHYYPTLASRGGAGVLGAGGTVGGVGGYGSGPVVPAFAANRAQSTQRPGLRR